MRRVVPSPAMGTVKSLGPDVERPSLAQNAGNGENGIGRSPLRHRAITPWSDRGANVDWNPRTAFPGPDLRKLDPFTMWALQGGRGGVRRRGPRPRRNESEERRERYGSIIGTGIGGITGIEEQHIDACRARPAPRQPALHPAHHGQRRQRSGRHPPRAARHGLHDVERLRLGRPRDRHGLALDPVGRVRPGRDRRLGVGHDPLSISQASASAKALSTRNDDPERAGSRARSTRTATAS